MNRSQELKVNNDIRLKEIGLEDVEVIFRTIDNERQYLGEWLPFVINTNDIAYTQGFIESYINSDRKNLTFSIFFQNQFVGLVGLKDTDLINKKTEIGYWLSEQYQHKGIITLSCQKLIEYAFDEMNINRIQLKAATKNIKSQDVAERLGFTHEGIEREGELHSCGFYNLKVYSLLRSDLK